MTSHPHPALLKSVQHLFQVTVQQPVQRKTNGIFRYVRQVRTLSRVSRRLIQNASHCASNSGIGIPRSRSSSMLLDEVATELASSATRNSSSGEITITAGGNYLKACGKHGNDDDDDDDDDSFQGSNNKDGDTFRCQQDGQRR